MGSPIDIYNEPTNAFVANFIGESNILSGIMHDDYFVEFAGAKFDCVDKGFEKDEQIQVVVRPEDLKLVGVDEGQINGIVESVLFKGVHYEMLVSQAGLQWKVHSTSFEPVGTQVGMYIGPDEIHIMKKPEEEGSV